jgi:hypothetical protein
MPAKAKANRGCQQKQKQIADASESKGQKPRPVKPEAC